MLIPNLAVLLAERRLTISKVSQDTGISRTTLTALTSRTARGIQFDTLNALAQYLKVAPGELFVYRPFDLTLTCDGQPGRSTVLVTVTRTGGAPQTCALACDATLRYTDHHLTALRVRLSYPDAAPKSLPLQGNVVNLGRGSAPSPANGAELDNLRLPTSAIGQRPTDNPAGIVALRFFSGACRPILAENSPLDCFPGARIHCGGEANDTACASKSLPIAMGRWPEGPEGADEVPVSPTPLDLLRSLPPSILADLERDILSRFDANLDPTLSPDDYTPELLWPWE